MGGQHGMQCDLPPSQVQVDAKQAAQAEQSALAHSNLLPCWAQGERMSYWGQHADAGSSEEPPTGRCERTAGGDPAETPGR